MTPTPKTRMDADQVENATSTPTLEQLIRQGEDLEAVEKTIPFWQALKQHKIIIVYPCYGYDTIANGASQAMPAYLIYFGHYDPTIDYFVLDSVWVSLWSSMTGVGQIIGAVGAGWLAQRIGRRWSAIAFASLTIVGVALQYIAKEGGLLLGGKIINGISVGALLAIGTTYASEIAPQSLRGPVLAFLAFFAVVMQMTGLGVVRSFVPNISEQAFRDVFAIQWLVGGLPMVLFILVPESPNWLLLKGKTEQAKKAFIRLYGDDSNIDARVAHLGNVLKHEINNEAGVSYIDCFRGTNLRRTLIVTLLFWGNGMIGSSFLSQNIYFLITAGLAPIHSFDIGIGGFALALLIIPFSSIFAERIGRRPLYLIGLLVNTAGMIVVGGLGFSTSTGVVWGVAILMNLLITWQLFTCFMVSWSMAPEISSYKLRQQTQGIGYVVQGITTLVWLFVTPYMYNTDAGNLGAKTGFIFAGSSLVQFIMAWFWIPETKGLSTEELDLLFEEKVSARKFATREVSIAASKQDM